MNSRTTTLVIASLVLTIALTALASALPHQSLGFKHKTVFSIVSQGTGVHGLIGNKGPNGANGTSASGLNGTSARAPNGIGGDAGVSSNVSVN